MTVFSILVKVNPVDWKPFPTRYPPQCFHLSAKDACSALNVSMARLKKVRVSASSVMGTAGAGRSQRAYEPQYMVEGKRG